MGLSVVDRYNTERGSFWQKKIKKTEDPSGLFLCIENDIFAWYKIKKKENDIFVHHLFSAQNTRPVTGSIWPKYPWKWWSARAPNCFRHPTDTYQFLEAHIPRCRACYMPIRNENTGFHMLMLVAFIFFQLKMKPHRNGRIGDTYQFLVEPIHGSSLILSYRPCSSLLVLCGFWKIGVVGCLVWFSDVVFHFLAGFWSECHRPWRRTRSCSWCWAWWSCWRSCRWSLLESMRGLYSPEIR